MKFSENANERLWDGFLKEILIEDSVKELSEFESIGGDHVFSEGFEKCLRKIGRSLGRKTAIKRAAKAVGTGAVAAASVLGVCFAMLLTQPKIHAAVGELVREVFSDHDHYSYYGSFDGEFDDGKRLGYVPDGYKLKKIEYHDDVLLLLTYKNPDGDFLEFQYGIAAKCELSVYPNDRQYSEKTVGGRTYYLYSSDLPYDRWDYVLWYEGDYVFSISGQFDGDEIIKIAENVTG